MIITWQIAFKNALIWLWYTIVGIFSAFIWVIYGSEVFLTPDITLTQSINLNIIIVVVAFLICMYFLMAGALKSIGNIIEEVIDQNSAE